MLARSMMAMCAMLLAACAQTTVGGGDGAPLVTGATPDGREKRAELPQCTQPLGVVALVEKRISVLEALELPSPLPMLNTMIALSGCFQIVDSHAAAIARDQKGKGRGKGIAPDYLLSADILSQNPDAGGLDTGSFGSFLPGIGGKIAGSLSVKTQEVKAALYLSDTKTGLQVTSVTGHAQTADVGANMTRFGRTAVDIGAYSNTPIGKTATAAFLDAYIKLVNHVKTAPPKVAKR